MTLIFIEEHKNQNKDKQSHWLFLIFIEVFLGTSSEELLNIFIVFLVNVAFTSHILFIPDSLFKLVIIDKYVNVSQV